MKTELEDFCGKRLIKPNAILCALNAKGFYLGGSRRMAKKYPNEVQIKENTDYDYNCELTANNVLFLENLGFQIHKGNPEYKDNQAVLFFKLGNISVIMRYDLDVYKRAFEMMPLNDYLNYHWKSSPFLTQPFNKMVTKDYFNNLFERAKIDKEIT